MENKSSESDEEQPNLSSSSAAATHQQIDRGISLGRDYDIIEDEAVLSSSPSYQSIPRTGQVIPIEESRSHNVTESKDSNSAGGSATTGSRKDTHGCNPFANLPRTITATSSDGNAIIQQQNETDDDALYCIDDGPPSDDRIQIKRGNADRASQQQQKEVERYEAEPLTNLSALPRVNCPEKIIICLDLSSEVNRVPFVSRDFTKYNPLDLIKRALNIFIRTKHTMNPMHEYALVILQDSAVWIQDFTSDVDDFVNVLFDLTNETRETEMFDLTSLFNIIQSKVDLPFVDDVSVLPPPYIIRTIFVYGRSNCVPELREGTQGREAQKLLSNSPYFFFDVFYVHEPPSEDNLCKEVYDVFLELDSNNTSYINEVGRNTTHLHNKMAMLLGHPLQRPIQMQASHSLIEEEEA